ncbi:hypothetical protein CDD81_7141 [Ophiocordyceps australis]|uniref:DUF2423 domain-containing protein n=1 Tax=Ophiocordyceps australis TaxID=1399860 RepID=A0A2C5Y5A7_9HYPO|nr:hypothetical protein CDD81_7141 [Ophiocordyceps australis]
MKVHSHISMNTTRAFAPSASLIASSSYTPHFIHHTYTEHKESKLDKMAKSSRSSTKKANNRRKAATVFGPAELARDKRLSAKLLELAQQPKPEAEPADVVMSEAIESGMVAEDDNGKNEAAEQETNAMVIDSESLSKARSGKKRIEKRKRSRTSRIVFPKYGEQNAAKRRSRGRR